MITQKLLWLPSGVTLARSCQLSFPVIVVGLPNPLPPYTHEPSRLRYGFATLPWIRGSNVATFVCKFLNYSRVIGTLLIDSISFSCLLLSDSTLHPKYFFRSIKMAPPAIALFAILAAKKAIGVSLYMAGKRYGWPRVYVSTARFERARF